MKKLGEKQGIAKIIEKIREARMKWYEDVISKDNLAKDIKGKKKMREAGLRKDICKDKGIQEIY